jgi:hypothetical protein
VHLGIILVNDQLDAQLFFYMFISILYMFRATSCSSPGESIVSKHLVCVTLCRWPSSTQVGKFLPDLHTRRSPTHIDTYQILYWYKWFSWWWAGGCSKHAESWNKHREKELYVKLVIYKNYTEMHGQQNIKHCNGFNMLTSRPTQYSFYVCNVLFFTKA